MLFLIIERGRGPGNVVAPPSLIIIERILFLIVQSGGGRGNVVAPPSLVIIGRVFLIYYFFLVGNVLCCVTHAFVIETHG